jgi:F420-dependent oxidoreductase-like protein
MTQIGLMIEGQDGLNWTRWGRILQAAEDFGYQCVFRSDHYSNATPPDLDSLELWVSLTYAASHTKRIEFGSLVAPTTFRHPALTVRMAAAVDDLSGGRLVLGLGAGWNEHEHQQFGVNFYDRPTRFEMLTEALEITTRLLTSEAAVRFQGKHFSLRDAVLLPRPKRPGGPPILIGGNGATKTLGLVVQYAAEWNAVFIPLPTYQERTARLTDLLAERGRDPRSVKRSLMTQVIYGKDDAQMSAKLAARGTTAEDAIARGLLVGTRSALIDQIGAFAAAGVERFMLQWIDQDDIDGLERMARDLLPHFHKP